METKLSITKIDNDFIRTILDHYTDPIKKDILINFEKYSEIEDKIDWSFVLDRPDLDFIQKMTKFGNRIKVCLIISDFISYDDPVKCIITDRGYSIMADT